MRSLRRFSGPALTCAAILFVAVGCSSGPSFKVAPSTAKVQTKIATAKRSTQENIKRTVDLKADTTETASKANTTAEHIDAALHAIIVNDYTTAAQELSAGKASNALVMEMLQQSLRNITSLGTSLEQTDRDLVAAEQEAEHVNKAFEEVVLKGARAQAVVDEVNWGFLGVHIGALFYFFKSVIRLGFIGIIVLIVLGIALAVLAATVGGPFIGAAKFVGGSISSWWNNRKTRQ